MLNSPPTPANILNGNATAAGTVLTIPANSIFTANVSISAAITGIGTARPTITLNSTGVTHPAAGSIVADVTAAGLATAPTANSNVMEIVIGTGASPATLDFALGGASAASVVINGFTF